MELKVLPVPCLIKSEFFQLQSCFAKHMIYLEEHRDVGDSVRRAEELAAEHEEYAINAMVCLLNNCYLITFVITG